jgi:hypothetical protein
MVTEQTTWQTAGVVFFLYIMLVAGGMSWLPARKRWLVIGGAAAGLLLIEVPIWHPPPRVIADWVLPPVVLLMAYWTSGQLFFAPMPRTERALMALDRRLRIRQVAAAMPRWAAEFLEFAYAGVYPVIPIALGIHLLFAERPDADRFWAIMLTTDFICFGTLPWVQTRPPRALEPTDPWHASFRRFNVRLLGRTSIHVNTFPSGHAAEALSAALLALDAPWPIVVWMFFNAAAISAGTVFGRYHYAADALAGWAVAVIVWGALSGS